MKIATIFFVAALLGKTVCVTGQDANNSEFEPDSIAVKMGILSNILKKVKLNSIWDHFNLKPFALYDEKHFFISDSKDLNMNLTDLGTCSMGDVDHDFIGNTSIKIADKYIAIWNLETISAKVPNVKLASLIAHEMFHCQQNDNNDQRFPDELLSFNYPITTVNIQLRSQAREELMNAVLAENRDKQIEHISNFFTIRCKQEKLIGRNIEYEKGIESIEGTAFFIEFSVLKKLTGKTTPELLKELCQGYSDISNDNLKIRQSTYAQGLLLSLLAADNIDEWTSKYTSSKLFISDFLKEQLQIKESNIEIDDNKLSEIDACIGDFNKNIDAVFADFTHQSKGNVLEKGFQITGFDPMNIVQRGNEVIHKNFLRIKINRSDKVLEGPVKIIIGEHIFDVKHIEW